MDTSLRIPGTNDTLRAFSEHGGQTRDVELRIADVTTPTD